MQSIDKHLDGWVLLTQLSIRELLYQGAQELVEVRLLQVVFQLFLQVLRQILLYLVPKLRQQRQTIMLHLLVYLLLQSLFEVSQ